MIDLPALLPIPAYLLLPFRMCCVECAQCERSAFGNNSPRLEVKKACSCEQAFWRWNDRPLCFLLGLVLRQRGVAHSIC